MAQRFDDGGMVFEDDDPYRRRVLAGMSPDGPGNLPPGLPPGISPPDPGNLPRSPLVSPDGPGNLPRSPLTSPGGPGNLPTGGAVTSPRGLSPMPPGSVSIANRGIAEGEPDPSGGPEALPRPIPGSDPNDPSGGRGTIPPAPGGYDLEALRKAWTAQGIGAKTSPEALKAFLASRPDIASGVTTSASGDALFDPSGRFIADAIADVGGRNTVGFLDNIDSSGKARVPKGKAPKGGTGIPPGPKNLISPPGPGNLPPGGGGGAPGGGGGAPPAANDFLTRIREMIMARMGELSQPVDPNDPAIRAQMDAARLQGARSQDEIRKALAERMVTQGGTGVQGGELNQAVQQSLERQGSDLMGLQGSLLSQRDMQNREQLVQLQGMALASGDAESARALQLQIARIDESIRRAQLAESKRQFNISDRFRNRQWDDEFGRTLGRDYEDDYWRRVIYGMQ